jgi:stage II sporulation protein M
MHYKLWVLIAIGLFVIGMGAGLIISASPGINASILSEVLAALEELGIDLEPFQIDTAVFILFKNALALLFSFIFSPILCLIPIIALTFNGMVVSIISAIVAQEESLGFVLAGLLPHGIFEIPALIIGEAAALYFGASVIMVLFSSEKSIFMPRFKQSLKYLLLALVLLVPAAVIETFVTPLFLQ